MFTTNRHNVSAIMPINAIMAGLVTVAQLMLASHPSVAAKAATASADGKPNIILILADDLGWRDLGCYDCSFYETPSIDRLAEDGLKFSDAYAACPVCSPTRASLLTGKYPATINLTNFLPGFEFPWVKWSTPQINQGLPLSEVTIATALKSVGYVSASIGKWHLGREPFYPEAHGFDLNFGGSRLGRPESYFCPYKISTIPDCQEGEYLTDRLAEEAIRFVERNRDRPFFLYWPHFAVHRPIQAPKQLVAKYQAKAKSDTKQNNPVYAAMLESLDQSVGRLLAKLEELKIAEHTVVIFYSDNGGFLPASSNAPLRDGKGSPYEGGIRVPLIIRWPGVIRGGAVCRVPVSSPDFFPTIMEIAGVTDYRKVDGESLVPLIKGTGELQRDSIYWHYPHYYPSISDLKHAEEPIPNPWPADRGWVMPFSAIREGRYKLIEFLVDGRVELYDLENDLSETKDLSTILPKTRQRLQGQLQQWRGRVGAKMPTPNPNFDVKRVGQWFMASPK